VSCLCVVMQAPAWTSGSCTNISWAMCLCS
jgi:hypothetical protein